jgi:polar amino acid transport system permease protein
MDLLLLGLGNTLMLTALAFLLGLPVGIALALARLSRHRVIAWPVGLMVDFLRCTPALVQLFWLFFALPRLLPVRLSPFGAALMALTVLSAAFVSEVFRGGIVSVERTQWEGARAIGMTSRQAMRRVILPQAVKRMIPVFLERLVELLKMSTIASTISYPDLLFRAQDIAQATYRPLEVFTVTALLYLVVIAATSEATRRVERHLARSGEGTVH